MVKVMQVSKKNMFIVNGVLLSVCGMVFVILAFLALTNVSYMQEITKKLFYALGKTNAETEYELVLTLSKVCVGLFLSRGILSLAFGVHSVVSANLRNEDFLRQTTTFKTVSVLTILFANVVLGIVYVVIAFYNF